MYFNSIADLLAQTIIPTNTEFTIAGYYKPGDGGGGTFIWVIPTGTFPPQDFGVIFFSVWDPNGYFQRIFSGPINVRWFGAIMGATDPNPPINYPSLIYDVTPYVHRARDSAAFANNGTLYFPLGTYPGAFVFTHAGSRNEINIIGDGWGTLLKSNTQFVSTGIAPRLPILTLGTTAFTHWRWRKVSNLRLDGRALIRDMHGNAVETRWSDGIVYANPPNEDGVAGRWQIDRVVFWHCFRGVYKPYGNIGNHYIDCTWHENEYGVYAISELDNGMHFGCDRYEGGEMSRCDMAVYYQDHNAGGGQIIFDGTIIEANRFGIYIKCTDKGRMLQCAVSIRNVYFENNHHFGGKDVQFEGVRSVRIDDGAIWAMTLINSSVNLFNCYDVPGGSMLSVDSGSSLVAYEHRYKHGISQQVFVNSISYDATNELGFEDENGHHPAPWEASSVWGPLRAVTSSLEKGIIVSTHFDNGPETWDIFGTNTFYVNSYVFPAAVLGRGSNRLYMPDDKHIWNKNVKGTLPGGYYYVWSIHTYLDHAVLPADTEFYGEITSEYQGDTIRLGNIYFRPNQWVCSYGMKFVPKGMTVRLAFHTRIAGGVTFNITDYQVVQFSDLASANSFVNSRQFAIHRSEQFPHKEGTAEGKMLPAGKNPPDTEVFIDRT